MRTRSLVSQQEALNIDRALINYLKTVRVVLARHRRRHEELRMGKLSAIAERIRETKERLELEAEKLAVKLDAIDAAAPDAFDRGHAFLDAQKAEVAEIEDTLRQLSNLPLERSANSPSGSKATVLPKPAEVVTIPAAPPQGPRLPAQTVVDSYDPYAGSPKPIAGFETAHTTALKAAE